MKVLVATVCVLLSMGLSGRLSNSRPHSPTEKIHVPPTCCFTYTSQKIPFQYVVVYFKTSSQCPIPAVIKGLYICANPTHIWVQEYIRALEKNA
uniref:Chemokine interleukin-8-like domain-containing protein n=1 Tax=Catagonus wagneri TaxID=51154 RepID=A0A8C3YG88_9CETA